MTAQQTPDHDRLRALADAATPGPWEDGVDDLTDDITEQARAEAEKGAL